jgi:hypothetical protein
MQILTLNIDTENQRIREICEFYWDLNSEFSFTYKVEQIALVFELKKLEISNIVKANCVAIFNEFRCKLCDEPLEKFKNRNELVDFFKGYNGYKNTTKKVCSKCIIENNEEEIVRIKKSFENGIFETLNDTEFQFLLSIAKNNDLDIARIKVGISYEKALTYLDYFHKNGIIGKSEELFFILPKFKDSLENLNERKKIKPIFFSKKVHDFYKLLKNDYLFVFPEVPLCSIVDKEDVQHLFNTPGEWLGPYYYTCRLDFVICDENGLPKFAIEYQGGYHTDTEKTIKRDLFKEQVLKTVGLELFQCPRDNNLVFKNHNILLKPFTINKHDH